MVPFLITVSIASHPSRSGHLRFADWHAADRVILKSPQAAEESLFMERFFKSFRRSEMPVAPTVEPRRDAHLRPAREPRASSMPALFQPPAGSVLSVPTFYEFFPLGKVLDRALAPRC